MTPREQIVAVAKATTRPMCGDFRHIEDKPSCCGSCHTDHDEFNYSLCTAYIPTDAGEVEADVCCVVMNWIADTLKT